MPTDRTPATVTHTLPASLSEALARTLCQLSPLVDALEVWLGGGTALAAKWHHRHSSDLDLFYDEHLLRHTRHPLPALFDALKALADRGEIALTAIRPGGASWVVDGTPVSLYQTIPYNLTGRSNERVDIGKRHLALEPSADIVLKKLRARMLHSRAYLSRDVYDVVIAHVEDPVAVRAAFAHLNSDERAMLRYDAEHQHIHERAGRDIADAAYPALAAQPAALVRYMRLALKGQLVGKELTGLRQQRHGRNEQPHPTKSRPQARERTSTAKRKGDTQGH